MGNNGVERSVGASWLRILPYPKIILSYIKEDMFYLKETINFASFSTKRPAVGALKFPKKTFPEDTIAKYHH